MPGISKDPAIRRSIPHRRFRPISAAVPIAGPGLYAGEPENCRRHPRDPPDRAELKEIFDDVLSALPGGPVDPRRLAVEERRREIVAKAKSTMH